MSKIKEKIYKLFNPKWYLVIIDFIVMISLTIYIFGFNNYNKAFNYIAYLVSAYDLVVVCIWFGKHIVKIIDKIIESNKYLKRFKYDLEFNIKVKLWFTSTINLAYVIFKFVLGVKYKSVWFITFSIYYTLLLSIKYNLLSLMKENSNITLKDEYLKYRKCGIFLLLMNLVLSMIILLIINQNQVISYPGNLIYVMAIYTFYVVISGAINLIKYRKYKRPIISASKIVSMATSLVSMLSLEVAMLYEFGTEANIIFNKIMIGSTGGVISVFIIIISLYMIIKSTEWLRNNKK